MAGVSLLIKVRIPKTPIRLNHTFATMIAASPTSGITTIGVGEHFPIVINTECPALRSKRRKLRGRALFELLVQVGPLFAVFALLTLL